LICLVAQLPVFAQDRSVKDALRVADAAQLTGFIGSRLDSAYRNRIVRQDIQKLAEPFANRTETSCWQSEFWGKWFTSAVLAYNYKPTPELKTKLDEAVKLLLATQSKDGYVGNYRDDKHLQSWDIWGRKYCLLGLISYYDVTKDKSLLTAASRIADHLVGELSDRNALIVRQGNHRGMAASSVLEPIVLLYNRTQNKKYLDFAKEIVRQWETPDGPQLISKSDVPVAGRFPKPKENWYGWEQGQKAYEMMSCYEGLLELYRITGDKTYFDAVVRTWEHIRDEEINIAGSGAAMEAWFHGNLYQTQYIKHYQETCVTVTWIKLSQQLLRLTGDARYADAIETSYYNALLGSMLVDGSDWAKYSPLSGERLRGEQQCGMGLNCCVASGPRGLFTLPLTAVMQSAKGAQINFFTPGSYKITTPGKQALSFQQSTDYPRLGDITISVDLKKPELFVVAIRKPAWGVDTKVTVNGEEAGTGESNNIIAIERTWKKGDVIRIVLDMTPVVHKAPLRQPRVAKSFSGGASGLPEGDGGTEQNYFAITRGPVVLSRDVRLGSVDTDDALVPLSGDDGMLEYETTNEPGNEFWVTGRVKCHLESHGERGPKVEYINFCDYASSGNTYSADSRFRVWSEYIVDPTKLGR
jgi:DUF1680 family protein